MIVGLLMFIGWYWYQNQSSEIIDFNYHQQTISSSQAELHFQFRTKVTPQSFKEGLQLNPDRSGEIRWEDEFNVFFTPHIPFPYGQRIKVTLANLRGDQDELIEQSYESFFDTLPYRLAYIGSIPEENRRLVIYQISSQHKQILTPKDWFVIDFLVHPHGKKIVFSATLRKDIEKTPKIHWSFLKQIYEIDLSTQQIQLLADHQNYLNYKMSFDYEHNLLLERAHTNEEGIITEVEIWKKKPKSTTWEIFEETLQLEPPVLVSPTTPEVLITEQQTIYLYHRKSGKETLLGNFDQSYGFTERGSHLLFSDASQHEERIKHNDLTVIDLVKRTRKNYLKNVGRLNIPQMNPRQTDIYFLLNKTSDSFEFNTPFHLYTLALQSGTYETITRNPNWSDEYFDLSQDGEMIILERLPANKGRNFGPELRETLEFPEIEIEGFHLWTYEIRSKTLSDLSIEGRFAQWLP